MFRYLIALAFLASSPTSADDHDAIREAVEAGQIKPLAEILISVQARYPGRVLDVELERSRDGRRIYDIELIGADGRKQDVHVDAATGMIIDRLASDSDARELMPLSELLRKVLKRYPGHVVDVELDRNRDQRDVYEVELLNPQGSSQELTIDAISGEVLDDDAHRKAARDQLKPLPDVLDSIADRYPGTVVEVELDRDQRGRSYYEIDIRGADGRTLEVRVDAVSGRVVREGEAD